MSHTRAHALRPVVLTVLAVGLLAACTTPPDDATAADEDTEVAGYSDELESTLAAVFDVEFEVQKVVGRLAIGCMSEAGFEVHPLYLSDPSEPVETDVDSNPIVGSVPPGIDDIPTVEEAAEVGLGLGIHHDPDNPSDSNVGPDDHLDLYWSEMTQDYRDAYDTALYGQSQIDRNNDENPDDGPEAKPGCYADVFETIGYEENDVARPSPLRPESMDSTGYETGEVIEVWDAWTMCVTDRGHPEFEYDEQSLGMWDYVALFYEHDLHTQGTSLDPPEGAPWGYEEALEKEFEFAADVAECADEVDLHAVAQASWDEVMRAFAVEHEEVIFAWYEILTDALDNAQAALSE